MIHADKFELLGDAIRITCRNISPQSVPVADIITIGEYTNEDGPFAEDHFVVLVTDTTRVYETAIENLPEGFFRGLGAVLGQTIETQLDGQTSFNSRIIWPASQAGLPLMSFSKHSAFTVTVKLFRRE